MQTIGQALALHACFRTAIIRWFTPGENWHCICQWRRKIKRFWPLDIAHKNTLKRDTVKCVRNIMFYAQHVWNVLLEIPFSFHVCSSCTQCNVVSVTCTIIKEIPNQTTLKRHFFMFRQTNNVFNFVVCLDNKKVKILTWTSRMFWFRLHFQSCYRLMGARVQCACVFVKALRALHSPNRSHINDVHWQQQQSKYRSCAVRSDELHEFCHKTKKTGVQTRLWCWFWCAFKTIKAAVDSKH